MAVGRNMYDCTCTHTFTNVFNTCTYSVVQTVAYEKNMGVLWLNVADYVVRCMKIRAESHEEGGLDPLDGLQVLRPLAAALQQTHHCAAQSSVTRKLR